MNIKKYKFIYLFKYILLCSGSLLITIALAIRNRQSNRSTILCIIAILLLCLVCIMNYITKLYVNKQSEQSDGVYSGTFYYFSTGIFAVNFFLLFLLPAFTKISMDKNFTRIDIAICLFIVEIIALFINLIITPNIYGIYIVNEDGIKVIEPFFHKKFEYNEIIKCWPKIETSTRARMPVVYTYITLTVKEKSGYQFTVMHRVNNDVVQDEYKYNELIENHRDAKMAKFINDHIELTK